MDKLYLVKISIKSMKPNIESLKRDFPISSKCDAHANVGFAYFTVLSDSFDRPIKGIRS